ncbi:hypothetical protein AND_009606 [Anopheles darlingi]|uniref:F5/8 type C domain-containing protein n=1 Tax=Anopheles darlingi TaxID=43151 RepID=W5J7M9_ANODA|nr:hypothetical protein AND_009606 [Anopheles darlingi]
MAETTEIRTDRCDVYRTFQSKPIRSGHAKYHHLCEKHFDSLLQQQQQQLRNLRWNQLQGERKKVCSVDSWSSSSNITNATVKSFSRILETLYSEALLPKNIQEHDDDVNDDDSSSGGGAIQLDNNGGAWCPKHMVSRGLKEYLQIDLLKMHVVTAIKTQGRFGKGQGREYTEAYALEYWRPGFTKWKRWKNTRDNESAASEIGIMLHFVDAGGFCFGIYSILALLDNNQIIKRWLGSILTGNINTYSEVEQVLQPIIFATKIRIYPYSLYDRTVCLRAEIIGCEWEGKFV